MLQKIAKSYSSVNSILHISACSGLLCNSLMDAHEIRRRNLALLIEAKGSQAALASELSMAPAILSSIITKNRGMGHAIARRIEATYGFENGWMDKLQAQIEPPDRLRMQLLYFYDHLSEDARDALLGKANSLFLQEHPDPQPEPRQASSKR